jgi:outer membrane immunogenic protein
MKVVRRIVRWNGANKVIVVSGRLGLVFMKTPILAGALLLITAGLGQAADMPLKAPPAPPPLPPPPVFNWTGFYVGADIGAAWGSSTTSSPLANNPGCFITILPCYLPSVVADINNQSAQRQSSSSVLGGIEAGYNLQLGYFVVGGETDISLYRLHGNSFASAPFTGYTVPAGGPAPSYYNDVNSNWLFTARGRLGFTPMTNLLVYGTGGVAVTNLRHEAQYNEGIFPGTSVGTEASTSSGTVTGAVYGGGLEWAWTNNWLVKAEYLHVNFGSVASAPSPVVAVTGSFFTHTASLNADILRFGIDYKFW